MAATEGNRRGGAHAGLGPRRDLLVLIVGFAVAAALIIGVAYWVWQQQAQSLRRQAMQNLVAVSDLKARQISDWLGERVSDAEAIREDPLLARAVRDVIQSRDGAQENLVAARLDDLRRVYGYRDVVLLDPHGSLVLREPASETHPVGSLAESIAGRALRSGQVVSSDLYLDEQGNERIEWAAPLLPAGPGGAPAGVVLLHSDPDEYLYPLIREWPVRSESGETLLVERRAGEVVFLNDLRHRPGAALRLARPLTQTDLPAAQAALGKTGAMEGVDYRGVPVFAAVDRVPRSKWYVIAKVDSGEVLGPIEQRGWMTAGFALALVAFAATLTLLLWRAREARVAAERAAREADYRALFENMGEGVALHELVRGPDGAPLDYRILQVNPAFATQTGLEPADVEGRIATEAYGVAEAPYLSVYGAAVDSRERRRFESDFSPLGRSFQVSVVPQDGDRFATIFEDVSERVVRERELRETRDYLENLFGHANAPVIVWDGELRVTRFNRAFEELTGRPAQEVLGRHLDLLFPADERREQALALVTAASAGERWETVEIPVVGAAGDARTVLWNSATIFDGDGTTPVATIAQGQDITERKRAEDELREAQARLAFALERSHAGGWDLDLVDHTAVRTLGHDLVFGYAELLSEWTYEMFLSHVLPEDRDEVDRLFQEAVAERKDWVFECRIRRTDGEVRWVRAAGGHQLTAGGEPRRMAGIVQDVTEERLAQEVLRVSEERFRYVFENALIGMSMTRPDGVVDVNAAFCRMLGYTREDLAGIRWQDLTPPEDVPEVEKLLEPMLSGATEEARFLKRYVRKDGSVLWADVSSVLRRDAEGRPLHFITAILDITQRKLAEDEVERLNRELEQRVLDRTAELDAVNQELEAFAYSVSHDLRAPLRHVSGFAALLEQREAGRLDERSAHYVARISASVAQMGVLIDDLLQFSRTGRAELRLETVDMDALVEEVVEGLREEAGDRDIEWRIGPLPSVVGDRALLRQVWANLLGNAVKYTRGREPARIEVEARAGDDGLTVYSVGDNGVGFDMEYVHKLFGVFQRLHGDKEFEGTGIGLANVHRIITRLGGRVWAEGEVDRGATFSFALPRRREV